MNRNEAILEGLINIGVDVCACVDLLPRDISTQDLSTMLAVAGYMRLSLKGVYDA